MTAATAGVSVEISSKIKCKRLLACLRTLPVLLSFAAASADSSLDHIGTVKAAIDDQGLRQERRRVDQALTSAESSQEEGEHEGESRIE